MRLCSYSHMLDHQLSPIDNDILAKIHSHNNVEIKAHAYNQTFPLSSISCRRCSNYVLILDLAPRFNGLRNDYCKTRRETLKF